VSYITVLEIVGTACDGAATKAMFVKAAAMTTAIFFVIFIFLL
jgi:hypothetical protein